jgi:hypothetical protein
MMDCLFVLALAMRGQPDFGSGIGDCGLGEQKLRPYDRARSIDPKSEIQNPKSKIHVFFSSLRTVESGGHPDPARALGDDGRSLGPYQIGRAYWRDAGLPGRYEHVRDARYAEAVILAYWHRHCPCALARRDFETLARVHNGGPRGASKPATLAYWNKVRAILERRR